VRSQGRAGLRANRLMTDTRAAAGENLKALSERLGHVSITLAADVYAHVFPTMQARATERLDTLLAGREA
jgi:integrase